MGSIQWVITFSQNKGVRVTFIRTRKIFNRIGHAVFSDDCVIIQTRQLLLLHLEPSPFNCKLILWGPILRTLTMWALILAVLFSSHTRPFLLYNQWTRERTPIFEQSAKQFDQSIPAESCALQRVENTDDAFTSTQAERISKLCSSYHLPDARWYHWERREDLEQ